LDLLLGGSQSTGGMENSWTSMEGTHFRWWQGENLGRLESRKRRGRLNRQGRGKKEKTALDQKKISTLRANAYFKRKDDQVKYRGGRRIADPSL